MQEHKNKNINLDLNTNTISEFLLFRIFYFFFLENKHKNKSTQTQKIELTRLKLSNLCTFSTSLYLGKLSFPLISTLTKPDLTLCNSPSQTHPRRMRARRKQRWWLHLR